MLVTTGKLETSRAREVLAAMIDSGKSAEETMDAMGIRQVDESALQSLCRELLDSNPKIVEEVKGGKVKAAGALIGMAKKKNPNVNPQRVRELCLQLIETM